MNKKAEFYHDIAQVLNADAIDDPNNLTGHSHILISAASNGEGGAYVGASVKGNDHQVFNLLMATLCSKHSPAVIKKVLMISVANMMADFDDAKARIIGKQLGIYAEEKFGVMDCQCEKCKARKN